MMPLRLPILRYCVPTAYRDEHLAECISICRQCGFEEVLLFTVDYLHQFYFDDDELDVHMEHLSYCADRIRDAGLVFSVNVMHTLGHLRVPEEIVSRFGFERQITVDGRYSVHPVLDPRCGRLREHMAAVYARYASLEPRLLFVDDDFRVDVNTAFHAGRIAEAAARLHCPSTREAVAARLGGGDQADTRGVLLELISRDLEEFAALLASATHGVAPAVRLGLMFADGVEFDVGRVVRALAGPHVPFARPQVPLYREDRPVSDYPAALWAVSKWRSILGPEVELYPECENYTYNDYAKSGPAAVAHLASSFARGESAAAVSLGSFATTVPAGESRRMIEAVARRRNQFRKIAAIVGERGAPAGVPIRVSGKANLELLGIPFDAADNLHGRPPAAVFGTCADELSETGPGFVMDIDALQSFSDRGCLADLGVRRPGACDLYQVSDAVFERNDRPDRQELFGLYYFLRNVDEQHRPQVIEADTAADWHVSSWITDVSGARIAPFAARWQSPSGRRFAFVNISQGAWPPHSWLHPWFGGLLADLLAWVTGEEPALLVEDRAGVTIQLCDAASRGARLITLTNFSTADYDGVPLSLSESAAARTYDEITPDGSMRRLRPATRNPDGRYALYVPGRLPCLDVRYLVSTEIE